MRPEDVMQDVREDVVRRAIAGARWVTLANLATIPFSFFTNVILGRTSSVALGYYAAIQVFVSIVQVFFILGGPKVFVRFIPAMDRRDRFPFVMSYGAIVTANLLGTVGIAAVLCPSCARTLLDRFGQPHPALVLGFAFLVVAQVFLTHFLYGILDAPRATIILRSVVVGIFLAVLAALGPMRAAVERSPASFLWAVSASVYTLAVLLGIAYVARTQEFRLSPRPRWLLPRGFWPAVLYSHLDGLVVFVYQTVAPLLVLFSLDVASLGRLHAALRWVNLLDTLPAGLTAMISPSLSRLAAEGMHDEARRYGAKAMEAAMLLLLPAALALSFFATDLMAVFGSDIGRGADLLRILALSALAGPVIHFGGGLAAVLGEFRSYLMASSVYVVLALMLIFGLVPAYGLVGAVLAATAGSFVQQGAVAVVLRVRLGFRVPSRVWTGWAIGAGGVLASWLLRPGRGGAAGLWILFVGIFLVAGRVGAQDLRMGARVLLGRS